ncbi:CRISPR-associated protein Cse2 [Imhoffiella purpurea]|uniref:CRISPR-associated protein, Cse2 family n=1 Tax=Imhoffiella purpurea TaxID=1249627 RepID=W9VET6_9GAMM|nr:CRISPR-associated protein Cse2 [Imhoffiella purpurea]EXJ14557.1 CRISPR-associated protein, Cse2 family [Imhoffiella purpurea]
MSTEETDFAAYHARFKRLPKGAQADLRRVAEPDDLRDTPGLYRLFPGGRPSDQEVQAAFFLPWCPKLATGTRFMALCADRISEERIIQIARANPPDDLVALRRLVMQLHPDVGWLDLAPLAWYWGRKKKGPTKRRFIEGYYIALHKLDQGDK